MNLTDEQRAAVDMACDASNAMACLTGGPGAGKTYTVRAIVRKLAEQGRNVLLSAPSGKAAQRIEESTGSEAKTIHRLLQLRPSSYDAEPVLADVVIVDESSMIDLLLMAALVRGCRQGTVKTLVFVGDPDQLPPVGCGAPFLDLLASGRVPTVRLTKIHRQAQDSGIIRAAYAIQAGQVPEWCEDVRLVVEPDAEKVPRAAIHGHFNSQVLAPQKGGPCGVDALNTYAEQVLWNGRPGIVRGVFRPGTKVIHVKNDYEMELFNGDSGYVVETREGSDPRGDVLHVDIGGQQHVYKGAQIKMLLPAWALTIHRSQGSQFRHVTVIAHPSHAFMLTRALLYVAVTRAAESVTVVGTPEAVAKAVRKVKDLKRCTYLPHLLRQGVAA